MTSQLHEAAELRTTLVSHFLDQMRTPLRTTQAELTDTHRWLDRARRFHKVPFFHKFAIERAKVHQSRATTAQAQLQPLIDLASAAYQLK